MIRPYRFTVFFTTLLLTILGLTALGIQQALSGDPSEKEYKKRQDKWFTVKSWTATFTESYQKDVTWERSPGVTTTTTVRSTSSGTFTLDSSIMSMGMMEWFGNGSGSSSMTQTTVTTFAGPDGDIIITEITEMRGSGRIGDLPDEDGYRENWGAYLSIDVFSNDYSASCGVPEDGTSTLTRTVTGIDTDLSELEEIPPVLAMFKVMADRVGEWANYSGPLEDAQGMSIANILGFGIFPDLNDSAWYDLPKSGLTLKGSYTSENVSRSWSLSPGGKVDPMVLEKTPEDWIPDLESHESATIRITGDGWNGKKVKVRFTLYEVTKEKGFCMNSLDQNTELDLEFDVNSSSARFDSPVETEDGWTIQTSRKVKNVSLDVYAYDWGAWGKLKAEVEITDDIWSPIFTEAGESYITIPRDERGGQENKIADAFEIKHHLKEGLQTMQDDEGSRSIGDGLTAYEEYRGFMIGGDNGDHITTNPEDTLDLFVHCESPIVRRYIKDGTVVGGELMIHLLDRASDYVSKTTRVINPNRGEWSCCEQHGIRLINEDIPRPGILGRAVGILDSPGTTDYVAIDMIELRGSSEAVYKITIIHELMHGCSVPHHGLRNAKQTIDELDYSIVLWNGVNAGDVGCTMQYGWGAFYRLFNGALAIDDAGDPIPFQNTENKIVWNYLCKAKEGIGTLKSEQLGPALIGNCISELRVFDD